jgi:hypothetical protein
MSDYDETGNFTCVLVENPRGKFWSRAIVSSLALPLARVLLAMIYQRRKNVFRIRCYEEEGQNRDKKRTSESFI